MFGGGEGPWGAGRVAKHSFIPRLYSLKTTSQISLAFALSISLHFIWEAHFIIAFPYNKNSSINTTTTTNISNICIPAKDCSVRNNKHSDKGPWYVI